MGDTGPLLRASDLADSSVLEIGCGSGGLLGSLRARRRVGIDLSKRQIAAARERAPDCEFHVQAAESLELGERFDFIVISDTLNFAADVQQVLEGLHSVSHPGTRLIVNYPSALWRPVFALARALGAEFERARRATGSRRSDIHGPDGACRLEAPGRPAADPLPREGPGDRHLRQPLDRARSSRGSASPSSASPGPSAARETGPLTVSVVIPARNEAGNIEAAVLRTPDMGAGTELIFVEGHSKDNTWEEIERVAREHPGRRIKTLQAGRPG